MNQKRLLRRKKPSQEKLVRKPPAKGITVSIVNMKGGVGKTTICLQLAHWLVHEKNKRVLVIDFDPQANASEGLLDYKKYEQHIETKKVISDIFTDIHKIVSPVSKKTKDHITLDNMICNVEVSSNGGILDLVPSELELCHILERPIGRLAESRLSLLLRDYKSKYDLILIDCGPTYSLLTTNALNASDFVLIPVKPDFFSIRGIPMMIKQITAHNLASREEDKVDILGIVFTMVKEEQYVTQIKADVLKMHPGVFRAELKYTAHYPISLMSRKYFLKTRAQKHLKENFLEFADEFLTKVYGGL